jgi:hypothetical protein
MPTGKTSEPATISAKAFSERKDGSAKATRVLAEVNTYHLIVCTVEHPGHRNLRPTFPPVTPTPWPQVTHRRFMTAGLAGAVLFSIRGVRHGVTATSRPTRRAFSLRP